MRSAACVTLRSAISASKASRGFRSSRRIRSRAIATTSGQRSATSQAASTIPEIPEAAARSEIASVIHGYRSTRRASGAEQRDYTMMAILLATGFRISELLTGTYLDKTGSYLRRTGKGRKDRCTPG
jgi:site-specific recombinase XerD